MDARESSRERQSRWRAANPGRDAALAKARREADPERHRERDRLKAKRFRENNPEMANAYKTKEQKAEYQRQFKLKNPGYITEWGRKKRERLAGRPRAEICEACQRPARTVFDHCHDSGEFRGWLCSGCNSALGLLNDDPEIIMKLAAYMEKHVALKVGQKS